MVGFFCVWKGEFVVLEKVLKNFSKAFLSIANWILVELNLEILFQEFLCSS